MDNVAIELRKAAIELQATDDIVKVAGLFKLVKRLLFGPEDLSQVKQHYKSVKPHLDKVREVFERMNTVVSQSRDSESYQHVLEDARRAISEAAQALSSAQQSVSDAYQNADSYIVNEETGKVYQEGQVDQLKAVQKGFADDPAVMKQLEAQRRRGLDVPITNNMQAPVQEFQWFQRIRPGQVSISPAVKNILAAALTRQIKERTSLGKSYPVKALLQRDLQNGNLEKMLDDIRKKMLSDAFLQSYWYAPVSKQVSNRPANEMEAEIDVGPVNLPSTNLWFHVRVSVTDLFAAHRARHKLSVRRIQPTILPQTGFDDETDVRDLWRERESEESQEDYAYQQWKYEQGQKATEQVAKELDIEGDTEEWVKSQQGQLEQMQQQLPQNPPVAEPEPEPNPKPEQESTEENDEEEQQADDNAANVPAGDVWWKDPVKSIRGAGHPMSFWIKFVQMAQRLGVNPLDLASVIINESGFDASARNMANGPNNPPVAQGLNQMIHSIATKLVGMPEEIWRSFYKMSAEEQLPWVEKYFQKVNIKGKDAGGIYLRNFGGFNNPDGSLYAGRKAQEAWKASPAGQKWMKEHPDQELFKRPSYQQTAIEQNAALVENDRIMPSKIRSMVKNRIGGEIGDKINTALGMTRGTPLPPYQEPSKTVSTRTTQSPVQDMEQRQEPQLTSQQEQMANRLDQLSNYMWNAQAEDKTPLFEKRAAYRRHLPKTRIIISIPNETDFASRVRFAHILRTALRNVIDAESSIHNYGEKLEIESDVYGSKSAVIKAAKAVVDGVAESFEVNAKKRIGKISVYSGIRSRYSLLESSVVEDSFRKFAMYMWSKK